MTVPIFRVEQPGLLTTVQDLGRIGGQGDGMVVAGVMDSFAAQVANILVGSPRGEGVLEITLLGPVLHALEDTLIAVCGADLSAQVGDESLPPWRTALARRGQRVKFGRRRSGARAYLAVAGGWHVPRVLGSKSTFLRGSLGGFGGRALRTGDLLHGRPFHEERAGRALAPMEAPSYETPCVVHVVPGPHRAAFDSVAFTVLQSTDYSVTPQSDRMGIRLSGPVVAYAASFAGGMLSEAVPLGGVQVPPDGQPILLMADRQTVGGYPLVGVVASADLPRVAQLAPGDVVSFQTISVEEAQGRVIAQERLLRLLEWGSELA